MISHVWFVSYFHGTKFILSAFHNEVDAVSFQDCWNQTVRAPNQAAATLQRIYIFPTWEEAMVKAKHDLSADIAEADAKTPDDKLQVLH